MKTILISLLLLSFSWDSSLKAESSFSSIGNPFLGKSALIQIDSHPPITPAWMLGHIAWEDEGNTQQSTLRLVREYLEHDIPVDAVIIDSPWSTCYNNFEWDLTRYPEPEDMACQLQQWGVKPILWLTSIVNETSKGMPKQKCDTFDYVVKQGYGINNSQSSEWWKGIGVQIDLTDRKAKKWFFGQLDKAFNDSFFGFKVDQGEVYFGDSVMTSAGYMSNRDFRKYYYDAMYDYVNSRKPGMGGIIARPYSHQKGFHAGIEKMSMGWCGDFGGDWDGLKLQINNIYTSAQAGYGAIGTEIAGFMGKKSNHDQFIRYAQFGCMTACMINGGENGAFTNHLPWWHGQDAVNTYRFCVELHRELIPYIFSALVDAHNEGGSLIQNMSFTDESHQLGQDIFTKAITSDDGHVSFPLPEGNEWVDFFNGKNYAGGTIVDRTYGLEEFPLYVRRGSVIPLNIENGETVIGYKAESGRKTLLFYPSGLTRQTVHWPKGDGTDYVDVSIEMNALAGMVHVESAENYGYTLIIREQADIKDVKGATSWSYDKNLRTLKIYASGKNINVTIVKEV